MNSVTIKGIFPRMYVTNFTTWPI